MLSIVSTPIGNLEDITFRAVRMLQEADYIACEDTRTSGILMKHYDIHTPLLSFHSYSSDAKTEHIIRLLKEGKHIALISDAGTPGISDPGFVLIRRALEENIILSPIPWASAVLSALVCSGMDTHHFLYLGFLPVKKGRQTMLKKLQEIEYTVVIYESVHRIERTIHDLGEYLWADKQICIGREITKKFEEFYRGDITGATVWAQRPNCKWEFVIVV